MIKLVIDRERWGRGSGNGILLAGSSEFGTLGLGTMCCLGFLALECGIERRQILGECDPVAAPSKKWPKRLLKVIEGRKHSSELCDHLTETNDSVDIHDEQREMKIADYMREVGVKVYFVDTKKEAAALKRKLKGKRKAK